MSAQIQVRFAVNKNNEIKGTVVKAPEGFHSGKIVFILGYKPEKFSKWIGILPKNDETWMCNVYEETYSEVPDKGVVFVKLLQMGTTVPAQFKGLDMVFNADQIYVENGGGWDYTTSTSRYPVFVEMITGWLRIGQAITATPDQELKIRKALGDIAKFTGHCPSGDDPIIALVFNGMTPEEAKTKIQADQQRWWDGCSVQWLKDQKTNIGKSIIASGAQSFGRIGILSDVKVDEKNNRSQLIKLLETGSVEEVFNTDYNHFLNKELVDWFQEIAKVALQQSVPSVIPEGYSDHSGIQSDISFPDMPVFSPSGGIADYLKSVKILFGLIPQVQIKTHYLGVIFGGVEGEGFTSGSIKLNPVGINPVGKAMTTVGGRRPHIVMVPANVRNPKIVWDEAQVEIRCDDKLKQRIFLGLANVKTAGSIRPDGIFEYDWENNCPYPILAEPGAAKKIAEQWASEFGK